MQCTWEQAALRIYFRNIYKLSDAAEICIGSVAATRVTSVRFHPYDVLGSSIKAI